MGSREFREERMRGPAVSDRFPSQPLRNWSRRVDDASLDGVDRSKCTPARATIKVDMTAHEVQIDEAQLHLISKALADPKRFEMLQKIAKCKDANCSDARDWTGLAPATVSHHLKELENAGLVHVERVGKFAHLTLRRDVWNAYLQRLASL
jgi:ArsR family transcriptional regulator, arsenate/arsenite/antimonite-responsive transcriptional repressor